MLPGTLAPLDPHKTRALTTIYAPRKLNTRLHKTAQGRMLDNDIAIKPTLSPFNPLPAIGEKIDKNKTKVIVFDLKKNKTRLLDGIKTQDVLKPLSPLRKHEGYLKKTSLDNIEAKRPQQLIRENTYDVLEPVYVNPKATKENTFIKSEPDKEKKDSPKTRFKKAAIKASKLSSMPETGKLLCLREKQTYNLPTDDEEKCVWKLQELPRSPPQKLDELSEIFQSLEMRGRHRDKMKKDNSWF